MMTRKRFEKIARKAIEAIPDEFKPFLENCVITIKDRPSTKQLREMEIPEDEGLYGLYEGAPLTEQSEGDPPDLPPRITLFYESFVEDYEAEEEIIHEIQTTVLHEVGHHFGLDEDRLAELGYE